MGFWDGRMIWKYVAAWVPGIALAILNAALRGLYQNYVGELVAHQISTVTAIILFALYFHFLITRWRIESSRQAITIGLIWLLLTVTFEFLFGHYVMGHPWSRLLHDYNILEGRLWAVFLIWITVAPYAFYRLES